MTPSKLPRITEAAVRLVPNEHAAMRLIAGHILDYAVAGQRAVAEKRLVEAKYYRDCCGQLIWRLGVDGLTASGQLRWDGAKYETRIPGRLSSESARAIRDSSKFSGQPPSALMNHLACEHIVPKSCLAGALVQPGGWDPCDRETGMKFLFAHAEVAILSPEEDARLKGRWKQDMPDEWWLAPLAERASLRFSRYQAVSPQIVVTPWTATNHSKAT